MINSDEDLSQSRGDYFFGHDHHFSDKYTSRKKVLHALVSARKAHHPKCQKALQLPSPLAQSH